MSINIYRASTKTFVFAAVAAVAVSAMTLAPSQAASTGIQTDREPISHVKGFVLPSYPKILSSTSIEATDSTGNDLNKATIASAPCVDTVAAVSTAQVSLK